MSVVLNFEFYFTNVEQLFISFGPREKAPFDMLLEIIAALIEIDLSRFEKFVTFIFTFRDFQMILRLTVTERLLLHLAPLS